MEDINNNEKQEPAFGRIVETSILSVLLILYCLVYYGAFIFNEYVIFDAKTTSVHGLGGAIVFFMLLAVTVSPLATMAIKRIVLLWSLRRTVWFWLLGIVWGPLLILLMTLVIFWRK
jgi:hypothetical protein